MATWNNLDDIRDFLGIASTGYDGILTRLESMSRHMINSYCIRPIEESVYVDRMDSTGKEKKIILRHFPVTTICAVTVSETAIDVSEYDLIPHKGILILDVERGTENIEVCYKAGWTSIPQQIKDAQLELIKYLFNIRSHVGFKEIKLGDSRFVVDTKTDIPLHIKVMLNPYREILIR